MTMPTQIKIDTVAVLKKRFAESTSVFVTDYAGLNVEQLTKLRRELRQHGVKYLVAKNTLMRIAAREAGYGDIDQYLSGPVAVAFASGDPSTPARILYDTAKELKELNKPAIKAFYIDKQKFAGTQAERIAKLPPRQILLSQLVAAVQAPISGFIGTLDSILRELVGTIDAMAKQKGEA